MDDAYIIGHEAEEARKDLLRIRQSLDALKEQCHHPRDRIINEERKTYCSDCDEVFWPTSRFWSDLSGFYINDNERESILALRERFTKELTEAEERLKRSQSACGHPRREPIFDGGDNIYRCVVCRDEID